MSRKNLRYRLTALVLGVSLIVLCSVHVWPNTPDSGVKQGGMGQNNFMPHTDGAKKSEAMMLEKMTQNEQGFSINAVAGVHCSVERKRELREKLLKRSSEVFFKFIRDGYVSSPLDYKSYLGWKYSEKARQTKSLVFAWRHGQYDIGKRFFEKRLVVNANDIVGLLVAMEYHLVYNNMEEFALVYLRFLDVVEKKEVGGQHFQECLYSLLIDSHDIADLRLGSVYDDDKRGDISPRSYSKLQFGPYLEALELDAAF